MRQKNRWNVVIAAGVAIMLIACGQDMDSTSDAAAELDGVNATTEVSPEVLAQLTARYPVLGSEPAPAPQPAATADAKAIPERYRSALPTKALEAATGEATYYADTFEGRRTASGIPFRQNQMVAAHRAFPFGTLLRVTNLENDRSVNVRVVDRGPFAAGRGAQRPIIDLSRRAANELGYIERGRTSVRVEVLEWGEGLPMSS